MSENDDTATVFLRDPSLCEHNFCCGAFPWSGTLWSPAQAPLFCSFPDVPVSSFALSHQPLRRARRAIAGGGILRSLCGLLDYRRLTDCAGGRNVTHAEVAADIEEAARWVQGQPGVVSGKIFAIGWSYGGGGVLAALKAMPPELPPLFAKAVVYYPDCRRAMPWSSTSVSVLMSWAPWITSRFLSYAIQ